MTRPSHYGKYGQRAKLKFEPVPKGHCRWCGDPIKKGTRRRSWCSQKCVDEGLWRLIWGHVTRKIFERDKVCRICGGASYKPNSHDLSIYRSDYNLGRYTPWGCDGPAVRVDPEWHVDHIKPVSEGGDDHPDNLRLLCARCHKRITKEWHGQRAAARREQRPHTLELLA